MRLALLLTMSVCHVFLGIAPIHAQGPALAPEPNSDEALEALRGTWLCVEALHDGKRVDNFVGVRAVLDGNNLTWIFPNVNGQDLRQSCKFEIDVNPRHRHFDWKPFGDTKAPKLRLYKLEDGMLHWATNISSTNRPRNFDDATWVFRCRKIKSSAASRQR